MSGNSKKSQSEVGAEVIDLSAKIGDVEDKRAIDSKEFKIKPDTKTTARKRKRETEGEPDESCRFSMSSFHRDCPKFIDPL